MTGSQQKRDGAEPVSESKRANAMRSITTPSERIWRQPQEESVIQRAIDAPGSLSAHEVLQLQQTIGNRAVQRLLSPDAPRLPQRHVQAKLTVGPANDRYEQEADLVAAQVINRLNTPLPTTNAGQNIQRQQTEEDEELKRKPLVQLQPVEGGMDVSPDLEASIQAARGGGQPLNKNVRTSMESAFGADFSGVKVHSDAGADMLNRSIQARAFTTGQDIFFRHGEYNPDSDAGKHLIAHELTHVIQQNKSTARCQNQVSQRKATLRSASREPFNEVSKTALATIQRVKNTSLATETSYDDVTEEESPLVTTSAQETGAESEEDMLPEGQLENSSEHAGFPEPNDELTEDAAAITGYLQAYYSKWLKKQKFTLGLYQLKTGEKLITTSGGKGIAEERLRRIGHAVENWGLGITKGDFGGPRGTGKKCAACNFSRADRLNATIEVWVGHVRENPYPKYGSETGHGSLMHSCPECVRKYKSINEGLIKGASNAKSDEGRKRAQYSYGKYVFGNKGKRTHHGEHPYERDNYPPW